VQRIIKPGDLGLWILTFNLLVCTECIAEFPWINSLGWNQSSLEKYSQSLKLTTWIKCVTLLQKQKNRTHTLPPYNNHSSNYCYNLLPMCYLFLWFLEHLVCNKTDPGKSVQFDFCQSHYWCSLPMCHRLITLCLL
jgi:hypothetical protein